ncbi:MAG: hypothetical protein JWO83_74 [Caulobacteraceae bacterium]|nr:hypothetical protein [Caulobacteraceae bacterium]
MVGFRNRLRGAALGLLAVQLAACASLPKEQAAAFKTLASGSRAGFAALSGAQAQDLADEQLALAADGRKRIDLAPACLAGDSVTGPCFLEVGNIALASHTERLRALLGGVGGYAGGMSDLAAAKDLNAAAEATGKVSASLKSLVGAVYPAGAGAAGAAVDALTFGAQQLRIRQRRATMLRLGAAADPVIAGTATVLGEEATQLRGILLDVRKTRLRHAVEALDAYDAKPDADPGKAREARTRLIAQVSAAAAAVGQARAIRADFTPLSRSHRALLAALRDPRADVTTSVAEAQAFQDALKSMTGLEPPPPPDKPSGGDDKESDDGR